MKANKDTNTEIMDLTQEFDQTVVAVTEPLKRYETRKKPTKHVTWDEEIETNSSHENKPHLGVKRKTISETDPQTETDPFQFEVSKSKKSVKKSKSNSQSIVEAPVPFFGSEPIADDFEDLSGMKLKTWARSRGIPYSHKSRTEIIQAILLCFENWRENGGIERGEEEPPAVQREKGMRYLQESIPAKDEEDFVGSQEDVEETPGEIQEDFDEINEKIATLEAENKELKLQFQDYKKKNDYKVSGLTRELKSLQKTVDQFKEECKKKMRGHHDEIEEVRAMARNEHQSLCMQLGGTENEISQLSNELFAVNNRMNGIDQKFKVAFPEQGQ